MFSEDLSNIIPVWICYPYQLKQSLSTEPEKSVLVACSKAWLIHPGRLVFS